MWLVWVNRLGIVLNFVAGFLVAPELLGIQRLERAERSLETFTKKGRGWLEGGRYLFFVTFRETEEGIARGLRTKVQAELLVVCALFWIMLWWAWRSRLWLTFVLPIVIYFAFVLMAMLALSFRMEGEEPIKSLPVRLALSLLLPCMGLTLTPIFALYDLLILGAALLAHRILGRLLTSLEEGDNRLRMLLVPVGIFFFIVGNLLQLIATF
jgi:hypothetical protein